MTYCQGLEVIFLDGFGFYNKNLIFETIRTFEDF